MLKLNGILETAMAMTISIVHYPSWDGLEQGEIGLKMEPGTQGPALSASVSDMCARHSQPKQLLAVRDPCRFSGIPHTIRSHWRSLLCLVC